jgi:CDP-4-dehydro-6-deoxyglucose reductase, E1
MIPNLIGNLPDWSRLRAIADKHGLILIEGSCDTIGYSFDGGTTGRLSDVVTTSFYASHVITAAGFGGMALFSSDDLCEPAMVLRGWGRASSRMNEAETVESRFQSTIDGIEYDTKFIFDDIGYNFLPSELAAAFGLVQLDRLDDYIARRMNNFARMTDFFRGYEHWFMLPRPSNKARVTWLAVPLIVRDDAPFTRRELQKHFERASIQTRTVFTGNVLRQPGFRGIERRESPGGFPNADRVMRGGMLVGCHQGMDSDDIDYVQQCFRKFVSGF